MAKSRKFSWVHFFIAAPVGAGMCLFALPLSGFPIFESWDLVLGLSVVVGLGFGLFAGKYGEDAWHAMASIW